MSISHVFDMDLQHLLFSRACVRLVSSNTHGQHFFDTSLQPGLVQLHSDLVLASSIPGRRILAL